MQKILFRRPEATCFQAARFELETLLESPVPAVAKGAAEAVDAAYSWEDAQEVTRLTTELLVAEVASLKRLQL